MDAFMTTLPFFGHDIDDATGTKDDTMQELCQFAELGHLCGFPRVTVRRTIWNCKIFRQFSAPTLQIYRVPETRVRAAQIANPPAAVRRGRG
jgi:hypothetical protein